MGGVDPKLCVLYRDTLKPIINSGSVRGEGWFGGRNIWIGWSCRTDQRWSERFVSDNLICQWSGYHRRWHSFRRRLFMEITICERFISMGMHRSLGSQISGTYDDRYFMDVQRAWKRIIRRETAHGMIRRRIMTETVLFRVNWTKGQPELDWDAEVTPSIVKYMSIPVGLSARRRLQLPYGRKSFVRGRGLSGWHIRLPENIRRERRPSWLSETGVYRGVRVVNYTIRRAGSDIPGVTESPRLWGSHAGKYGSKQHAGKYRRSYTGASSTPGSTDQPYLEQHAGSTGQPYPEQAARREARISHTREQAARREAVGSHTREQAARRGSTGQPYPGNKQHAGKHRTTIPGNNKHCRTGKERWVRRKSRELSAGSDIQSHRERRRHPASPSADAEDEGGRSKPWEKFILQECGVLRAPERKQVSPSADRRKSRKQVTIPAKRCVLPEEI